MTREEFEYLQTDQARRLIDENIECEPSKVALRIGNAAVATQIKNLQKCRTKLPSYYAARCIIPTLSYEQSSSETAAFSKTPHIIAKSDSIDDKHGLAVDLTCGLGVDSLALSRRFDRVVAVEIDPLRVDIARWNFERLGALNIEVVCSSAEDFIANFPKTDSPCLCDGRSAFPKTDSPCLCDGHSVDLIYVDPSRRSDAGRSVYAIEQCQPNVLEMLPALQKISGKIDIKLSPLFDVQESFRLFGRGSSCEVITVDNECKEVVVHVGSFASGDLIVTAIRSGVVENFHFTKDQIGNRSPQLDVEPRYLLVPNVGFYKSRTVSALMEGVKHHFDGGYVLVEEATEKFCGSVYEILEVLPYQPKTLRKRFKQAIVHLHNFPFSADQIGIKQGGLQHLFMSNHKGEPTVFVVNKKQ